MCVPFGPHSHGHSQVVYSPLGSGDTNIGLAKKSI